MRLYGRLKMADEARLRAWSDESGRSIAIARVFNLTGPYINKQSSYALACFINDALEGRPIEIRADRPVYRSFIAIRDLMSIVVGVLTDAHCGCLLFDTAGDRMYEMGEIADVVSQVLGHGQGVVRRPFSDQPAEYYVGDGAEQDRLCQRFGVAPANLHLQVEETARFMAGAPKSV
jgi:nucleoside-diphosphate-sugar epimerase